MTRDTEHISCEQQQEWWAAEPRDLWLFDNVAYALLTKREGKTWISLGIFPYCRGSGLGTRIYAHFPGVWAEIQAHNLASIHAAEKAGYEMCSNDGRLVVMRG